MNDRRHWFSDAGLQGRSGGRKPDKLKDEISIRRFEMNRLGIDELAIHWLEPSIVGC